MCFKRKASLGRYNGNRADWRMAYREARVAAGQGHRPDPQRAGITWKAMLIVAFERHEHCDALTTPVRNRLETLRLINEIVSE